MERYLLCYDNSLLKLTTTVQAKKIWTLPMSGVNPEGDVCITF